jgi:hypothetical protein
VDSYCLMITQIHSSFLRQTAAAFATTPVSHTPEAPVG